MKPSTSRRIPSAVLFVCLCLTAHSARAQTCPTSPTTGEMTTGAQVTENGAAAALTSLNGFFFDLPFPVALDMPPDGNPPAPDAPADGLIDRIKGGTASAEELDAFRDRIVSGTATQEEQDAFGEMMGDFLEKGLAGAAGVAHILGPVTSTGMKDRNDAYEPHGPAPFQQPLDSTHYADMQMNQYLADQAAAGAPQPGSP